ncbi:SET domain-containing histone-lysine N-methyltransferase [Hyalangium gracile]|uniref:SET domain-containing histone-lysine N-methyltransferase n=1 Tax=Hyalangium gracile TaxID=394092 RepID=UPI001CCA7EE8|nr:SET domain-containing histone-lysine N-methyltransferase [Hyalangium gracile]
MGAHPEVDPAVARFLRWLEQGGSQISKVHIVTPEGGERGVLALDDIAPGETLLRIPRRHVLTVEDVRASEMGQLLDAHAQLDEERTYLSAFLLQERERGEDSFWKPFLDMLPKAFPSHPFFFEEHELALLQGSFLAGMVGIQQRIVAERYVHLSQHVPGFNRFTFDAFVWAHFAVVTRTFTMTRSGSHASCLVPLVDMINDGRPWDSPWAWLEEEQCFQVKSLGAVAAGQELHTTYGNKSNLSLLLQYGYVHEDNAHDEVLLLLGIPPGDAFTAEKQRLLGLSSPDEQRSFKLSRTYDAEAMAELFAFLRIAQAEAGELSVLEAAPDALALARAPLSPRNEEKLHAAFAAGCEKRLAGYATSLEEDERLLREEALSPNARNCILLRRGEKRLLQSYAVRARAGFPSLGSD